MKARIGMLVVVGLASVAFPAAGLARVGNEPPSQQQQLEETMKQVQQQLEHEQQQQQQQQTSGEPQQLRQLDDAINKARAVLARLLTIRTDIARDHLVGKQVDLEKAIADLKSGAADAKEALIKASQSATAADSALALALEQARNAIALLDAFLRSST